MNYRFCECVITSVLDEVGLLPVGYVVDRDRNRCTVSKENLVYVDGGNDVVVKYRGVELWVGVEFVHVGRFVGDSLYNYYTGYTNKPLIGFRLSDPDCVTKCSGYVSEWLARGGL